MSDCRGGVDVDLDPSLEGLGIPIAAVRLIPVDLLS